MSRITKDIAKSVANKLTATQFEELQAARKALSEKVTTLYQESLPKEINKQFAVNRGFFYTDHRVNVVGVDLNHDQIDMTIELPYDNSKRSYCGMLFLSDSDAKEVSKALNEIKDKRRSLNALKEEIEIALYALRTYAMVEKQFPEAFPLLPPPQTTAVMVNITAVREKLQPAI